MENITFQQIIDRSQAVAKKWAEHDPQPWPVEVKIVDLNRMLGELSSKVLQRRGFKKLDISTDASQELATLLFIIFDIAQDLDADLAKAYLRQLSQFEEDLS